MFHLGVTGSRYGMFDAQADEMYAMLRSISIWLKQKGASVALHHGDCTGADAECAEMGRHLGLYLISHPPVKEEFRAYVPSDEYREPKGYHERNRDIVDGSQELLAAPKSMSPKGGTWYTINYAKKLGKPVHILPFEWVRAA